MLFASYQTMNILKLLVLIDFSSFVFYIQLLLDCDELSNKTMEKSKRNRLEKKSSQPSRTKKFLSMIFCSCIPSRQ